MTDPTGDAHPDIKRAHVLLVCSPFFSYHEAIKSALVSLGFHVTWWNDRASDYTLNKVALRLLPNLVARLSTTHFLAKVDCLEADKITHVLVVKGESLSAEFVRRLRQRLSTARMILYLWDGIENARGANTIASLFDAVATFDPLDANRFGWRHRPLFARRDTQIAGPEVEPLFDWCFIGTLHSDRHRVIHRLRCSDPGQRSFVFGYVPGKLMLVGRYVTDWTLWRAPEGSVSTYVMPADRVSAICQASRAVLDIEHPRQRGLTMRTIETLLSSQKLITTNRHVLESDLFDPTRVHVISRDRPIVSRSFFDIPFRPIPNETRQRYLISQWALDLFGGL